MGCHGENLDAPVHLNVPGTELSVEYGVRELLAVDDIVPGATWDLVNVFFSMHTGRPTWKGDHVGNFSRIFNSFPQITPMTIG